MSILIGVLLAKVVTPAVAQEKTVSEQRPGIIDQHPESRFTIAADPRMELLAVVQHFTSWAPGGHIKSQTTYKEDIDDYFEGFQNHPAMAQVEGLVQIGFTHDAPVAFMLHHGPPPELEQKYPYSDYLITRAEGEENLTAFADVLRDFARQTDFMRFYRAHQALYDTQASEVISLLQEKDYVQGLEDFYGDSRASYGVILPPLFAGGYGITVKTPEGYDIYGVIGPCSLKDNRVTFACLDYLESIILHEWSHSFVNPLVDRNLDHFKQSSHLFDPIEGMMRKQAYPNWRICLYEHIVRACEIHLRDNLYEDFHTEKFLSYQEGKGFWYITHIDSLLNVYEIRREEYPSFSQFVPMIATGLSQISVENLPRRITSFHGPLDAIFPRADSIYIVYPTALDHPSVELVRKDLYGFANFLSSAQIEPIVVSDTEALKIDWSDKIAFLYASPGGNVFFHRLSIGIPLRFSNDVIEFGEKRYEGDGVLFISCVPNPFNERLPFALVAANRPQDLIGASMRMGGKSSWNVDYVIFHGDELLETGRYHKEASTWSLAPQEP
jgi:hypothetical protein